MLPEFNSLTEMIKRKRGRPPKVKPELKLETAPTSFSNNHEMHPFPKSAQLHYKTKE